MAFDGMSLVEDHPVPTSLEEHTRLSTLQVASGFPLKPFGLVLVGELSDEF